jgi:hypothetical protein
LLVLAYLTYISFLVDWIHESPYHELVTVSVSPISGFTVAMIYLNGIIREVFDRLLAMDMIAPDTFSIEWFKGKFFWRMERSSNRIKLSEKEDQYCERAQMNFKSAKGKKQ